MGIPATVRVTRTLSVVSLQRDESADAVERAADALSERLYPLAATCRYAGTCSEREPACGDKVPRVRLRLRKATKETPR